MWSHFDVESDCSKACYHCMGSLCGYMAYFSPLVDGLAYCSWKCHTEAMATYHPYEQFILEDYFDTVRESRQTLEQSGTLFLAYKAVTSHPADYFLKNRDRLIVDDPQFVMAADEEMTPIDQRVKSQYNMVTHDQECKTEDRVKVAIRSAILLKCLVSVGYLGSADQHGLFFMRLLYHFQA